MHPMNKQLRNHSGRLEVTNHTMRSRLGGARDTHTAFTVATPWPGTDAQTSAFTVSPAAQNCGTIRLCASSLFHPSAKRKWERRSGGQGTRDSNTSHPFTCQGARRPECFPPGWEGGAEGGSPLVKVKGKGERAKETLEEKLGVQDECFFAFHHQIASLLS